MPMTLEPGQMQSAGKTPSDDVFGDSIRAMRRPIKESSLSVIAVAVLLSIAIYPYQSIARLAIWLVGVVIAQYLTANLLVRLTDDSNIVKSPALMSRFYVASAMLSGGYWGVSTLIFLDPMQPLLQLYVALALGGMATANAATQAFYPPMQRVYVISLIVPFASWALLQGDRLHIYLGVGMLLLVGHLLYFGQFHSKTLRESIELRHHNAALLAQLLAKTEALEKAGQAKSLFFAAASHDLRQPLQALGYYTSLLRPLNHDAPSYVDRIEQCISSLDQLLEGVLGISKLDSGRVVPVLTAVPLHDLVQKVASLYGGVAGVQGLQLRVRARPVHVWSDATLLERILVNLLSNALRYTHQGGVLLAVRLKRDRVQLQIIDTGVGISDQNRECVFDEYVQLDNPNRDPSKGVGLGLATVRRLCTLLQHPLALRSVVGRGSCFELTLPLAAARDKTVQAMNIQTTSGSFPMALRALVVDDHEMVRESLLALLGGWGFVCDAVGDGQAALELAASQPYDIVLCDGRLPGELNGVQVLVRVRELLPELRFSALISGETDAALAPLPHEIPVLSKPVSPIRLRALLMAHLHETTTPKAGVISS